MTAAVVNRRARTPKLRKPDPYKGQSGLWSQRWTNPLTGLTHAFGPLTDEDLVLFRAYLVENGFRVARDASELQQRTWRRVDIGQTVRFSRSLRFETYAREFVQKLGSEPGAMKKASPKRKKELDDRLTNWFGPMFEVAPKKPRSMVDVDEAAISAQRQRFTEPRFALTPTGKVRKFTLAPVSQCHFTWFLRSIVVKAFADGVLPVNLEHCFADLQKPEDYQRLLPRECLALAEEHWRALLFAAATFDRQTYLVLRLMLNTGLRIGEALALQPQDIDADTGYVHIRRALKRGSETGVGKPKGASDLIMSTAQRDVPLPPDVAAELVKYMVDNDIRTERQFVFPRPTAMRANKPWGYDSWHKQRWERVEALAHKDFGLPVSITPVPYSFRHTYGSALLNGDVARGIEPVDIFKVSKLLGHRTVQVTQKRYVTEDRRKLLAETSAKASALFAHATPRQMPESTSNGWYTDVGTGKRTRYKTAKGN